MPQENGKTEKKVLQITNLLYGDCIRSCFRTKPITIQCVRNCQAQISDKRVEKAVKSIDKGEDLDETLFDHTFTSKYPILYCTRYPKDCSWRTDKN